MSNQKKECGCASSASQIKLIEAMTAQNKLLVQIVDQNSQLIEKIDALLEQDDDEPKGYKSLDE